MNDAELLAESTDLPGFFERIFPGDSLFRHIFTLESAITIIRVVLAIVIGIVVVALIVSILKRFVKKRTDSRTSAVIIKVAQYLGIAVIVFNAFDAARVDLSALLGAAGIAGIAIGFAAQTSVSNFISGFFLLSEKTFGEGDSITVDEITGSVYSVDSLSVKVRTFDNKLVRIPNETLIKTNVLNLTRFPVRRFNMELTVLKNTNIEYVRKVLLDCAMKNHLVLRNPEPLFLVNRFGQNGLELLLGLWFAREDWVPGMNSIHIDVQKALKEADIDYAFPVVSLIKQSGLQEQTTAKKKTDKI